MKVLRVPCLLMMSITVASSTAMPVQEDESRPPLVVIGETLIDSTGARAKKGHAVVIEGNRITQIGPKGQVSVPDGAQVIEVRGATVLPGLVDAHTHPAFYLPHPRDFEDDSLCALRGAAILKQALDGGITLVRDLGARHNVAIGLKLAIQKGYLEGPRFVVANQVMASTGAHGGEFELMLPEKVMVPSDSPGEWRRNIRKNFALGADFTKVTPPYTAEEVGVAVETTHSLGALISVHAGGRKGGKPVAPGWYADWDMMMVEWAVAAGADIIEHLYPMKNEAQVIEMMKRQGTIIVPTVSTSRRGARDSWDHPSEDDNRFQLSGKHYEDRFRKMHQAGIPMAVATDVEGQYQNKIAGFYNAELKQFMAWGYSAIEVLQAATQVGAMTAGLGDSVGTLEVGKLADVIVVPGNPLDDITVVTRPILVIKDGEILRDRRKSSMARSVTTP